MGVLQMVRAWSVATLTAASTLAAEPTTHRFAYPERLRYDHQCLTIDGKDTFVFSGAFHYFRCPRELWHKRFDTIKAAGFNAVETYVPWNYHEREAPRDTQDYSKIDLTELVAWMKMAHDEFGLYTIIRPGPYICAEWAVGGYPAWLLNYRTTPFNPSASWLRSDDPTYLAWCEHWFKACCPVIAPQQLTRRPPGTGGVILFQLENEYDLYRSPSEAQRLKQLQVLRTAAIDGGIDVPLFTCVTKQGRNHPQLSDVFDAVNSYPRWGIERLGQQLDASRAEQPHAPGMVAELQGGWFSGVGGKLSEDQEGITAAQCNGVTLMAIAHGATLLNYYMLFGGTNFGDWGGRTQTTTYDYNAPIREPGGVDEKYAAVWGIGRMLQQVGPRLARATEVECNISGAAGDLVVTARRAADDAHFIFLWNRSRQHPLNGSATLKLAGKTESVRLPYDLTPFGFKVLELPAGELDASKGKWLPEPMPPISRPAAPPGVTVQSAEMLDDALPSTWQPLPPNTSLAGLGINDSRYVYYQTHVNLSDEQAGRFATLEILHDQPNAMAVAVNERGVVAAQENEGRESQLALGEALHAGDNTLTLLYENAGYPNFGPMIEATSGLLEGRLIHQATPSRLIETWKSHLLPDGQSGPGELVAADYDDSTWPSFTLNAQTAAALENPIQPGEETSNAAGRLLNYKVAAAVFRAAIDLTQQDLAAGLTRLAFGRIDDRGAVYVNGQLAATASQLNEALAVEAKQWLKPGRNTIAVLVNNHDGPGGLLRPVKLAGGAVERLPLTWRFGSTVATPPSGAWRNMDLNGQASSENSSALGRWYRVHFTVPPSDAKVWVPWRARIAATGNGMITLNGHALGRWWQAGPQVDYYLPEPWLKAGETNELVFFLSRTDQSPVLRSVEIRPYEQYAERQ